MITLCYIFTYIFEQFISYIYCTNKFEKKLSNKYIFLVYSISFFIQYLTSFLNTPLLNIFIFIICNFAATLILFKTNILQGLFTSILLASLMIITELCSIFTLTYILKIDIFLFRSNDIVMFLATSSSKSLYFIVTYLVSMISIKEDRNSHEQSYWLVLIPTSSIITLHALIKISTTITIDTKMLIIFSIVSISQLMSSLIVFILHERIIKTIKDNADLKLEAHNAKIKYDYYTEIEKQNEKSSILIHDIKNCLSNIKSLSQNNNNQDVIRYIDSVYKIYSVDNIREYSKNKLLNTIITRYANICYDSSIRFSSDIRYIDFSFMDDAELTALFDNLLQNSYEAAKDADDKFINLSVDIRNENYVTIKLYNSYSKDPTIVNNTLITTKNNQALHGLGMKSIKKIVNKHNGSLNFSYDSNYKIFY